MADTKLADLTALTTPSGDDLLYVVDDPAGTPADRKLALDNLFTRGTVTTSSPVIDAAQTWNASGTTFTALKLNVTDTASASGSLLMDLQTNNTSRFSVRRDGAVFCAFLQVNGNITATGGTFSLSSDLFLTRRGAANLRLGAADAASPVAQTLSVQSVSAGTTNTAGANLTITGSQGTGTGAGGSIIFQVAPAGSSGTAQNALATAMTIEPSQRVTFASAVVTGADLYLNGLSRIGLRTHVTGVLLIANTSFNDFDRLQFGGTTSSFPALKRSSATLQVRLADDSADAGLQCAALTVTGNLTISTKDIVTDTTTGTKIGTGTTQKIGFYNATPVVQPTAVADATDAATVITQLNALLAHMRTLGLIAT